MSSLFVLLLFLSVAVLIIALVKPSKLRMPSCKHSAIVFGGTTILLLILVGITAPPVPETKPAQQQPPTATPAPPANNTKPVASQSDVNKQAVTILTSSTDNYAALYANAKKILGTTQFDSFRTSTCMKNDSGQDAIKAFQNADDLYSSANLTSPDALNNWNYDMATLSSDICLWAGDAVSWQIKEVSSAKLQGDEKKVDTDFTTARADIQAIAK